MVTLKDSLSSLSESWIAWDLKEESECDAEPLATVLIDYKKAVAPKESGVARVFAVLPNAICLYELTTDPDPGRGTDLRRTLIPSHRIRSVIRISHVRNTPDRSQQMYGMQSIIMQLDGEPDYLTVETDPNWYSNKEEESTYRMKEVSRVLDVLIGG